MTSRSRTTAPSIFASSRRRVAENSMSSGKPPVAICSTTLSWPRTMSAPVRPRRIRSSPSRSSVPGATAARVARSSSSSLCEAGTQASSSVLPRSLRARPRARMISGGGSRSGLDSVAGARHGAGWARCAAGGSGDRRSSAAASLDAGVSRRRPRGGRAPPPRRRCRPRARAGPSGTGPDPRTPAGTTARVKPSRAASARRRWAPVTGRTSPARPISPKATVPCGSGRSVMAPARARVTARSAAGSVRRTPPTVER